MRIQRSIFVAVMFCLLTACGSSPEKDKARAEAQYTEEKTKTLQEYKACVKKAKEDQQKLDACERLLKAAE
jgi:outer membrane biogenesis lipoprotein LolB